MKTLTYDRSETRLKIEAADPGVFTKLPGYKALRFKEPFVTNVYFGAESSKWPKAKLPVFMAIKARFYEEDEKFNLFRVSEAAKCIVEIKLRDRYALHRRRKIRVGEESNITYGEFQQFLREIVKGDESNYPVFAPLVQPLKTFIKRHKVTGIKAVGATNYRRRHFEGVDHRFNIDEQLKFYTVVPSVYFVEDMVFSLITRLPFSLLETKHVPSNESGSAVLEKLDTQKVNLNPTKKSKGYILKQLLNNHADHSLIMPEQPAGIGYNWVKTEREIKLSVDRDPRELLANLSLGDNPLIYPGTLLPGATYQQVLDIGENGVFLLSKSLDPKAPRLIKYKRLVKQSGGPALVRTETVLPYSDKAFESIKRELDPAGSKASFLPTFCRHRLSYQLYMAKSRHVFEIYGDHVELVEGKCQPLDQLEIEYLGHIDDPTREQSINLQSIHEDFEIIRGTTVQKFQKLGIQLQPTATTKYQWIKSQSGYRQIT